MSQLKNVKRWLERIEKDSSSDSVIVDALLKLRPISKRQSGIKDIHDEDGVDCLLRLIQRPNRKILDISISLLANCLTEEYARKKVLDCQGIPAIMKLINTIKDISIITRSCRSIANLASNIECCKIIHSIGGVQLIVKVVKDHSNPECLISALRALKNLANTPGHRKKLVQNGAVTAIAKCLDSQTKDVLASASSTLAALSQSCTLEFADHMLGNDADVIKKLVKLVTEDEAATRKCKDSSLSIIIYLTLQGCARPTIGSVGGLKCIVDQIKIMLAKPEASGDVVSGPLEENAFCLVGALCYCCREAINRARLRSLEALPLFVQLLSDNRWHCVHTFILNTLLCFVYDEVGLKVLHENGIFQILLRKLSEFTLQEKLKDKKRLKEKSKDGVSRMWDGHDVDEEEKFDRRHSLSYDIPTKFNQRPANSNDAEDTESAANAYTGFEVDWRAIEGAEPYSPQWSPAGPSPVPDELAFAGGTTPAHSPLTVQTPSTSDVTSSDSRSSNLNDATDLGEIERSEPVIDHDESSSSRDGFDLMHSPALLPAAKIFRPIRSDETSSSTMKRERGSSTSSDESDLTSAKPSAFNEDVMTRVDKDLRQASKKARIENMKENDARLRSRSLEVGSSNAQTTEDKSCDVFAAPRSPPSELTLPDMGESICSPSFLQFVSETCSVPPLVLRHAGRDAANTSTSSSLSASTSIFKQARRRRSSGGGNTKKSESAGEKSATETSVTTSSSSASRPNPDAMPENAPSTSTGIPQLTKAMSSPTVGSKTKIAANPPSKDSALAGPDPVTLDQVVLCLICHYCEVSDAYVVSLAQQEGCSECLTVYVEDYPNKLYSKLSRIIDRLTACPECFQDLVSSYFIPSIAAALYQRRLQADLEESSFKVICSMCELKTADCEISLDNMWHNIALVHSTLFGSNSLKRMLTKGDEMERIASTCTLLLLALWYNSKQERLKNVPSSTLKYLMSDLQLVSDGQKVEKFINAMAESNSTKIFSCVAYCLHMLCQMQEKNDEAKASTEHIKEMNPPTSGACTDSKGASLPKRHALSTHMLKHECKYGQALKQSVPDKTLVFEKSGDNPRKVSGKRKLRSSTVRKSRVKNVPERHLIQVHVEKVSEASPVLSAMFQGRYRESRENNVEIHDVPCKAALYVIHRIYGCNSSGCTVLQDVLSEMNQESSRYQNFCKSETHNLRYKECPVEMSILRIMDMWLLQEMRKEFCTEHTDFFLKQYIEVETSSICHSIRASGLKKATVTEFAGTISTDSTSKKHDKKSALPASLLMKSREMASLKSGSRSHGSTEQLNGWFFLKFVANHGFSDLVNLYIRTILSPCIFNHNHVLQGMVFSSLANSTPCSSALAGSLNDVISKLW